MEEMKKTEIPGDNGTCPTVKRPRRALRDIGVQHESALGHKTAPSALKPDPRQAPDTVLGAEAPSAPMQEEHPLADPGYKPIHADNTSEYSDPESAQAEDNRLLALFITARSQRDAGFAPDGENAPPASVSSVESAPYEEKPAVQTPDAEDLFGEGSDTEDGTSPDPAIPAEEAPAAAKKTPHTAKWWRIGACSAAAITLCGAVACLLLLRPEETRAVMVYLDGEAVGCAATPEEAERQYGAALASFGLHAEMSNIPPLSLETVTVPKGTALLAGDDLYNAMYPAAAEGTVSCVSVTVDGALLGYLSTEAEALTLLEDAKKIKEASYSPDVIGDGVLTCVSEVLITSGRASADQIGTAEDLLPLLCGGDGAEEGALSYEAVSVYAESRLVPYETELVANDTVVDGNEGFDGVTTMISPGVNGLAKTVTEVRRDPKTGEELGHRTVSDEIVTEPVNAVSYEGSYTVSDPSVITGTYIWPLPELPDRPVPEGTDPASLNPFALKRTYVSSVFGERDLWGQKDFHLGWDIVAPWKTEIYACDGGVVVFAAYTASYGYTVRIRHGDGMETQYSHMWEYTVKAGDTVSQGQCIGLVGSTGTSSGNHLHLEFRRDHVACDPKEFISAPEGVTVLDG